MALTGTFIYFTLFQCFGLTHGALSLPPVPTICPTSIPAVAATATRSPGSRPPSMNEAPQPTLWPTVTIVDAKDEVKVAVLSTFATVRYSLFSDDKKLQFKNEYKIALAISTGVLVSKVVVSRITAGSTVVESEISTPTEAAAFALQSTITNQRQAVFSPTNGFNVTV